MTEPATSLVVGTAGHVDHGKTSLVRALTGVDLDRLPEEKARGITIALGFTPLTLPSGRVAGLVDVPGHERLVRTMIAGASGLDAVLLCVSAVEGVMPQTREHLDILGLLGVRTGVLVLTMADQVDEELLELAREELREQVRGTFLAEAPIVATSALSGQGLDELRATLDRVVGGSGVRRVEGPFRLAVDRSFARRGFGTVVTGTAWSGRLVDGVEVEVWPPGAEAPRPTRVRGIQVHGEARGEALAGARTALNLAGLDVEAAPRGAWVATPGALAGGRVVDVRYHHLPNAPAFEGEVSLLVLHGTREVEARLVPLDAEGLLPGASALVQLRCAEPLPCLPGDHFVVRVASPAATVGGGTVLDPWSPVTRRARAAESVEALRRLEAGEAEAWLLRAGAEGLPEAEVRRRAGRLVGARLGERWFHPEQLAAHRAALHEALDAAHASSPLTPAHNRKALRVGLLRALPDREYLALLDEEVAGGRVEVTKSGVCRPGWEVKLSPAQLAWREKALAIVAAAGLEGSDKLREAAPSPDYDALLHTLRDEGKVDSLGERVLSRAALDEVVARVRGHFADHPRLDPAAFKELTGLTRTTAIPLLEWLDREGWTRRAGNERVPGPQLARVEP